MPGPGNSAVNSPLELEIRCQFSLVLCPGPCNSPILIVRMRKSLSGRRPFALARSRPALRSQAADVNVDVKVVRRR